MKKQIIAATAAVGVGIFLLFASKSFQANAKGEEDFRINGTTLTAYVGTDTFASIPNTVTTIGEGAFAGNTTLQKVELPNSLREIQYNAFGDCTALANVTIPDSVTKVGPGAFKGCSALTMVELGRGITSWGSGVFNDCTSLDKLIVDDANTSLIYYSGALYNGDMTMLYQVLAARSGENYVMPEEVKQIDTYAFWNLQNTKNVKVSSNVSAIPAYAMSSMGSVENVILPNSVTSISEKAFANNESLKQVMIPASVNSIHDTVFINSANVKILTTKNSQADTYGQSKKIPVIYTAELPTDFNDSNADAEDKPVIKHYTVSEETQENDETSSSEETQDDSSTTSVSDEENPLDTKETGVVGKTRIVNGQAIVLIGKTNQKVYGTTDSDEEADENATGSSNKQNNLTNHTISEKIIGTGRVSFALSDLNKTQVMEGHGD